MKPPSCDGKGKMPVGAIVGGVVGGIAFAVLLVAFLVWWGKRKRRRDEQRRLSQASMRPTSRTGSRDPEVVPHDANVHWVGPPRGHSTATTEEPLMVGPRGSTVTQGEGYTNAGNGGGSELMQERTMSVGSPQSPEDIHQPYQLP